MLGAMLLYGYGSYGIIIDADFGHRRFSLVDALDLRHSACARRFGDEARLVLDGRPHQKNTFTDFIVAPKNLIRRLHARGNIVVEGPPPGMLMGGQQYAPELWAA